MTELRHPVPEHPGHPERHEVQHRLPRAVQQVGQAAYNKAVTCTGQTITFNLKKSVPDFNFATTLPAFAPFEKSVDKGDKSNFAINSDGPYMLQGTWQSGKGGTLVRNPKYDPKTDDPTIRRALPDKFTFIEGLQTETVFDRLLADSGQDQTLVTDRVAPPAYLSKVAAVKARYTDVDSPFNDYVVPNFTRMTNPKVRQALAMATNRTGYITAGVATQRPTRPTAWFCRRSVPLVATSRQGVQRA